MLKEIRITNFAIIDELRVDFAEGLNVITGETGAGKSIIIGALGLILGERASLEQIRGSEDSASVEALFDIGGRPEIREMLEDMGVEASDELVIKRVSSRSGKGRTYINGSLSNIAYLNELGGYLINICGQHENQLILDARNHIRYLDAFGGLEAEQKSFSGLYEKLQDKRSRLCELENLQRNKIKQEEFIRFQLREIESANVLPGEDEALLEEKNLKGNVRRLTELAGGCYESLYERKDSALSELAQISARIKEIRKIDPKFRIAEGDIDSVIFTLDDMSLTLREYLKGLSFDPGRLEEIEERLEVIKALKRKYGGSIESVLENKKRLQGELAAMASLDEELEQTRTEMGGMEKGLVADAQQLSGKRKQAARELQSLIEDEIHELRMSDARFQISFREPGGNGPVLDQNGIDNVEFIFSANKGQGLKPLNKVASGGELSRVMLAFKKILAGVGRVGTLVFDEVDAGLGGAAAEVIGEKLAQVAKTHQVICITHLPQIACFGRMHFLVSKSSDNDVTSAQVKVLSKTERIDEITRMMAGVEVTKRAREHAREMLEAACREK